MNRYRKLMIWIAAALIFQLSIYLYLDRVLLAPTSSYQVFAADGDGAVISGKAYYSRDRRYMAIVKNDAVEIYAMPGKKPVRTVELGQQRVSYFTWLPDRDLALMGLHSDSSEQATVVLSQVRPVAEGHELSATIKNLPKGSKITDVAYSTATNVIYMQILTATNPERYRVYRTDANHDLARIYLRTERIGRITVLYDHDALFYDNLADGTVIAREGDGSWRHISPYPGNYRLVGVDMKNNIYIAHINKDGLADQILKGRLKAGFEPFRTLPTPRDINYLKVSDFAEQPAK